MLTLTKTGLQNTQWKNTGFHLPQFDIEQMNKRTRETPKWIHIAPSNLYIAEIAPIQQVLLEAGIVSEGIVGIETWDAEVVDRIYIPHDNLRLRIVMPPDGNNEIMVVASTGDMIFADISRPEEWERALKYFANPTLQMVTITCTEKGYKTHDQKGSVIGTISEDIQNGPSKVKHIMSKIASFTYQRYKNGNMPLAFVSMDNISENGKRLFDAVVFIAKGWVYESKLVEKEFLDYLYSDKVSFPWTIIDRITPSPAEENQKLLRNYGIADMDILRTSKVTFTAPFVNTEHISYLVIEDKFPNGRPPLEKADSPQNRILFVESSEIVNKCEKMKVGTCLNPIHTTLATFGCILGYNSIFSEMKDSLLKELVYKQAYEEGLPVVVHPGVINPEEFLKQVLEERLVNPNIPDTPQRIATDTSQKVPERYGGTIKAHRENAKNLTYIPLAIAGWCRYLLGIDDEGKPFELSSDPMLGILRSYIAGIEFGKPETVGNKLRNILGNTGIFGVDLFSAGIGEKIEQYVKMMIAGKGSVKTTLKKILQ